MATVSFTLKMFETMNLSLKSITQSENRMLSTMSQIQNAADEYININKSLTATKTMLASAEIEVSRAIEQSTFAQERLNSAIAEQPAWNNIQTPDIYNTTGIERFKSEMASAADMISRLQTEQAGISAQAQSMDILPPEAKSDIETMQQRIRGVFDRMEEISNHKNLLKGNLDPSEADRLNVEYEALRKHLNMAVNAQQELNAAMKQGDISAVNAAYEQLHNQVDSVEYAIRDNIRTQEVFNRSVPNGTKGMKGILSSVKSIAANYLTIENAQKLVGMTIGGAMQQQQTIDTLSARAGSSASGNAIYDRISKQALDLGQDVNASLAGSMSFMSATTDPEKLAQLSKLAMRLAKLNPEEGLQGAAASMKELMSGDYKSIGERFNISDNMLQNSSAMKAGNAGDVDGFIKGMDELLNSRNMTEEVFENMLDSPAAKWQGIIQAFQYSMIGAGQNAMAAVAPIIDTISEAFKSGKFQPFFDMLSNGLTLAAIAANGLVNAFMWIWDAIQQNWGIIEPILVTIGGALTAWATTQIPALIVKLWGMVKPIAIAAFEFLTLNWPILLIGAAIGLLIYAMIKWGDVVAEVVGFIGGIFGAFFAWIFNQFAYFVNAFIAVGEFIINVLKDPAYALKKLVLDLTINILQYLQNVAKGIEDIINSIPGVEINITSGMDNLLNILNNARDGLKSETDVATFTRLEQIDYGEAFNKGRDIGKSVGKWAVDGVQSLAGKFGNMFSVPTPGTEVAGWNPGMDHAGGNAAGSPNINRVAEVGRINDTVDISSEDLKMMRELAEMKNIQNFVTLTPSVNVQTGPIGKETDIDTIVSRIKDYMEIELASSAQGVYS